MLKRGVQSNSTCGCGRFPLAHARSALGLIAAALVGATVLGAVVGWWAKGMAGTNSSYTHAALVNRPMPREIVWRAKGSQEPVGCITADHVVLRDP